MVLCWFSGQLWRAAFVLLVALCAEIRCREAIRPTPDIDELINKFGGLNINGAGEDGPPCILDIQKDLPKSSEPQPLYIIPDTEQFWLPNAKGKLQVPHGATIELHCTKAFANTTNQNMPKNTRTIQPSCVEAQTFQWRGDKYALRQFTCAQPPKYNVERLEGQKCGASDDSDAQLYRIGFNITRDRFLETMRVCHVESALRTHYTQHLLLPANVHFQRNIKRLNFSKAGYFGPHNMNRLYTQQNQREQAGAEHAHLFDNSSLFLARGHLAAKSDLIYGNQQRSTFTFFNAAPQWQSFNGGAWATLEDEVRRFVNRTQLEVDCYTGTWGTLALGGDTSSVVSEQPHPFYLAYDENRNGLLPVPRLFYRVIVERRGPHAERRGIALVGVNNPHASLAEILGSYVVCEDVREQVPWLRWIRNGNLKKGYIYACHVDEFVRVVRHLPTELDAITALLDGA